MLYVLISYKNHKPLFCTVKIQLLLIEPESSELNKDILIT